MWHYVKEGWIDDSQIGPLSDDIFLQLVFDGKLKPSAIVLHPVHTNGQWLALEQVPRAITHLKAGNAFRAQQKQQATEERNRSKEHEKKLRDESKRLAKITKQQKAQAAFERRIMQEAVTNYVPVFAEPSQFRCPYCSSTSPPFSRYETTTAGWIFVAVLFIFLCWPLCWIGIFFREQHTYCSSCGIRFN